MADVSEIADLLDAAVPLLQEHHIAAAVLYGSYAKGTNHATSDIDIAVWPDEGWTTRDWDNLTDALEELPTLKKWDLCRMNGFVSSQLKGMIARDGIVLFGSPGKP